MIEKYGLTVEDIKGIGLFDSVVLLLINEGYRTPFEVETAIGPIIQKELNKVFNVDKINIHKEVEDGFRRLVEKGFINEDNHITEKGKKLVAFLNKETDVPSVLSQLPKKVKEKIKEETKPEIRIYDDDVVLIRKTPEGRTVEIFKATKEALEYYFTKNPDKFIEFVDWLGDFAKKQIKSG